MLPALIYLTSSVKNSKIKYLAKNLKIFISYWYQLLFGKINMPPYFFTIA